MAGNKKVMMGLGIGCGALLLVAGICGGFALLMSSATSGPTGAANGFLADVRAGNHASALQRMTPGYQQTHPGSAFPASLSNHPVLTQQTDSSMTNVNISNNSATVAGTMTTPSGPIPIAFTMTHIGDYWYINSVIIQGVPLR